LASLLESADKVANTASVYGAFLKHLKKSDKKNYLLNLPSFSLRKRASGFNEDSNPSN